MPEQTPGFPPTGAYAIEDPHEPWLLSYWKVGDHGLEAWPIGSGSKYGPPRPPKSTPGGTPELRHDQLKYWRGRLTEYRDQVLLAIARDPDAAAARFVRNTDRCHRCRGYFHAEQLPESAATGRGRADEEPLTVEQRRAMVADLRRAGHPEKLIAQLLGISPGTVNTDARRSGIGAPLRPKNGAHA